MDVAYRLKSGVTDAHLAGLRDAFANHRTTNHLGDRVFQRPRTDGCSTRIQAVMSEANDGGVLYPHLVQEMTPAIAALLHR